MIPYDFHSTSMTDLVPLTVTKRKKPVTELIAVSLPLNSSMSSKRVFISVSDFGDKKKKKQKNKKTFETLHFRFNFPHYTQAKVKFPHLGRPYKSKSNSSLPRHRKCSQMPGVCLGGVTGGGVAVSI